jgi:hypothetical protein
MGVIRQVICTIRKCFLKEYDIINFVLPRFKINFLDIFRA